MIAAIGIPALALAGTIGSPMATGAQSFANVSLTLETFEDAATLDQFKAALATCTDPLGITVNVVDVPGSGAAIYPGKGPDRAGER